MGFRRTFHDPRPRRLRDAIDVERSRVALRTSGSPSGDAALEQAGEALTLATEAHKRRDVESGWAHVHQARRLQVELFEQSEVTTGAKHLEAELAGGEFYGWRRIAIEGLLAQVLAVGGDGWSKSPGDRKAALAEAWTIRNDSLAKGDLDLAITRRYQAILICVALAILLATVIGSGFVNPDFVDGVDEWWVALAAALAGALGGSTSALQRTTRRGTTSVYRKHGTLLSALSRPVVGAIAGITVFLAVRAGATQPSDEQVAYVLLVSFGAGFAERLVVRDPREELAVQAAAPTPGTSTVLPTDEPMGEPGPTAASARAATS